MTRPVLILQHLTQDHPAWLGTWLQRNGIPSEVRNTQAGEAYPDSIDDYRALAVLGGEMSANDPLPSLRRAEALIVQGVERGIPVIGHCLGGQLMARALGATVGPSPLPEVGWHPMARSDEPLAEAWFGPEPGHRVFQWHGEAFSLPAGATALATSAACPVQAFGLGPHLAMQFHVELDLPKLEAWAECQDAAYLAAQQRYSTVHSGTQMVSDAVHALGAQQRLADRIYRRWLQLA